MPVYGRGTYQVRRPGVPRHDAEIALSHLDTLETESRPLTGVVQPIDLKGKCLDSGFNYLGKGISVRFNTQER